MQFRLRLFHLLHLASGLTVLAVPWDGAGLDPTARQSDDPDGWSPAPTAGPAHVVVDLLLKRQASDPAWLCGYVTGNSAAPVSCVDHTRTCVFNTILDAQACCLTTPSGGSFVYSACTFFTSCVPYSSLAASCNAACSANTLITKCGPSNPLCYTYSFATIDYRNFGCSTRSYLSIVYLDATDTPSGPVTSTTRITSTSDTSTTRITSITSTPSTASPTSTTAASSTPTSIAISGTIPPSATATSSSSPKPVGAIVGGVVGGVAIIGIFAAVIAWIVFKKRGQSDQPAAVPPTDYGNPPPNQGIYAPQPVLAPQYPVGNQPYGMAQAPNPGFGYQQPGVYPAKMELDSSPTSTTPGSPAPAYGAFGR